VVTVRDGQSVVIGGLIQTTQEQRRTKVPLLGDIPVLGLPFRSKVNEARKTELLVIVTPRVIPGIPGTVHGMAEDVSGQAIDRMEDPSRVLDFLENIKADIKATREKQLRNMQDAVPLTGNSDNVTPPLDRPASMQIPAPTPASNEPIDLQRHQDGPRVVPK